MSQMLNGLWDFLTTDMERTVQDGQDNRTSTFCLLLKTWLVWICISSLMHTESCTGKLYNPDSLTQTIDILLGIKPMNGPTS
jgi:hypothetical protein